MPSGRKKLPARDRKTERFLIRVSYKEKNDAKQLAMEEGIDTSRLIRRLLHEKNGGDNLLQLQEKLLSRHAAALRSFESLLSKAFRARAKHRG